MHEINAHWSYAAAFSKYTFATWTMHGSTGKTSDSILHLYDKFYKASNAETCNRAVFCSGNKVSISNDPHFKYING